jgi:hypothetical protein
MKRIDYPQGKELQKLKNDYVSVFKNIVDMNKEWKEVRKKLNKEVRKYCPSDIKELLIMDFEGLVDIYLSYILHSDSALNDRASKLFDYSNKYQPKIAKFFMKHAVELKISTCYYCDLSYINTYESSTNFRKHFDLDHFLPKSYCPIVALSLMNFVPSCPTCNEKLKGSQELGKDRKSWIKLSPTSPQFVFDEKVKIQVDGPAALKRMDSPDEYKIHFIVEDNEYNIYKECFVDKFHLEERYDFHKCEALRLIDLINDYPTVKLQEIVRLLNGKKSVDDVREDILGLKYTKDNHRIMEKLKKDILETYLSN